GAPFAEAVRVHVEALAIVEAEAGIIGAAVAGMGGADLADHLAAGHRRVHRGEIDREEFAVGALRGAGGAAVELLVAIAGDRLDPAERGDDLVADEAKGGRNMLPLVARGDLEAVGIAGAPRR